MGKLEQRESNDTIEENPSAEEKEDDATDKSKLNVKEEREDIEEITSKDKNDTEDNAAENNSDEKTTVENADETTADESAQEAAIKTARPSLKKKLADTVSKAKAKVLGASAIAAKEKEAVSNEDKKDGEETRKDDEEKESLEVDSTKIEQKEAPKNGLDVPEKSKKQLTEEEKKDKIEKLKELLGDVHSKIENQIKEISDKEEVKKILDPLKVKLLAAQMKLESLKDKKKSKGKEEEAPKLPSERGAANLVAAAENKTKKALGNARNAFKKAASKVGLIDEDTVPDVVEVKKDTKEVAEELKNNSDTATATESEV